MQETPFPEKAKFTITSWQERELPEIKERDIDLDPYLETDHIVDIVGVRRSGKTYLMFYLIKMLLERGMPKENILYLNLEDRRLHPLPPDALDVLYITFLEYSQINESKPFYLFLDEIQSVEGWQRWIRSIYDDRKGAVKIFVSGSSSSLLKKEASLLTGRHTTLVVYPFSFKEFLWARGFTPEVKEIRYSQAKRIMVKKYLLEYLENGGFPEVVLGKRKGQLLENYYTDIIYKDIVERHTIRNIKVLEYLSGIFLEGVSTLFSYGKARHFLKSMGIKTTVNTIQEYSGYLEDAFLHFQSSIFSFSIKDRLQYPRKIYCIDPGLRNAVSFRFSKDTGRLLENIVFLELKRRKKEVYYWKDARGREVDFIIKDGLTVTQALQVSWDIEDKRTRKREIDALISAMGEFNLKEGIVITGDEAGREEIGDKTVRYVPAYEFLLKK